MYQELPGLEINFRDGLTEEQQATAAASVHAFVARNIDTAERRRAANERRAAVEAAVKAPWARIIQEDPVATDALSAGGWLDPDDVAELQEPMTGAPAGGTITIEVPARAAPDIRTAPYDYEYFWHDTSGPPFPHILDRPTGEIGLDARVGGEIPGGVSHHMNLHAGFGVLAGTDREVDVILKSWRPMRWSFSVGAAGTADAISEGGIVYSAWVDGQFVRDAWDKRWRQRVSGPFQRVSGHSDGDDTGAPFFEMLFRMRPGPLHAINVGAWAYAERNPGVAGDAAGQSLIQGKVVFVNVFR